MTDTSPESDRPAAVERALVLQEGSVLAREVKALRAELERARRLRHHLWEALGRPEGIGVDAELVGAAHDWRQSSLDREAEMVRLERELLEAEGKADRLQAAHDRPAQRLAELPEVQCPGCGVTIRARMSDAAGRARDEAAQAVVQAARALLDAVDDCPPATCAVWASQSERDALWTAVTALDALARAHEEAGHG